MLSKESFYVDDRHNAYVIERITGKTVLFRPVKTERIGYGDISSAYLYDTVHKVTTIPDDKRKSVRYRLANNVSTEGRAVFYENKDGRCSSIWELEGDTFTVEHNLG